MTEIPKDIERSAREITFLGGQVMLPFDAGDARVEFTSRWRLRDVIANAILAERKRCAEWCDKTAFMEWEQGELAAQRALNKARDCILSGDDA